MIGSRSGESRFSPSHPPSSTHAHAQTLAAGDICGVMSCVIYKYPFFFGGTACLKPYSSFTSNQPSAGKWLIYIFTPFQIILAVCVKLVFKEICYRKCIIDWVTTLETPSKYHRYFFTPSPKVLREVFIAILINNSHFQSFNALVLLKFFSVNKI